MRGSGVSALMGHCVLGGLEEGSHPDGSKGLFSQVQTHNEQAQLG